MTAKLLIGIGAGLIVLGLVVRYAPWAFSWFGNLPGDIDIRRENSRVFVPITSMILISVVASIIINVFFRR